MSSPRQRRLGVCYYPEHWPEARWAEDARLMAETGLTLVRIGEFAWSRLEPTPGDLRFQWLDRAIETLADAGLTVVLGTPTATPPRWMLTRHPDMLAVSAAGQPRGFGSRRHYCFSHLGYRAEAARIAGLLAERYGDHPALAAWQTDNEYGCHDTTLSYSDAARTGFRAWLAARYGQIDSLNRAWGNVFWSMEYRTYDEIDLPNIAVTVPNPAHELDFRRYASDAARAFNAAQVAAIRAHSDRPILHNFMGRELSFDHFDVGQDLDAASWDSYPLGFLEDRSDDGEAWRTRFARQGDPDFQAFHHDLYRSLCGGRWWVMEQQPGPVNWAPHNPAPLPGMVRLWAWEAFAHGAEAVVYFRWRQAPFAQEQMHAGLLRPDAAPAPGLAEAAEVAAEIASLPEASTAPARVALLFDYEAAWAWQIQPQGRDFDYFRLVFGLYRALRQAGLAVDIRPPEAADFSPYALILAPGLLHWRPGVREALVASGAQVLIGPRAGSKTESFAIPETMPPDFDALGVVVERVESLRPTLRPALEAGGTVGTWREILAPISAEVLEQSTDGHPVLTRAGRLHYLAAWPDGAAARRIVSGLAEAAGLTPLALPDGLRFRDAGGVRIAFNYGDDPVDLTTIPGLGMTGILPPAGVARCVIDG